MRDPAEGDTPISVRDHRRAGWFWIQNELLDPERFPELDPYDIAVYCALAHRVNSAEERAGCFPSRRDIAEHARCSPRKVSDCLKKLERLGIIRIQERHREDGSQTSHAFLLLDLKRGSTSCKGGLNAVQGGDARDASLEQDPLEQENPSSKDEEIQISEREAESVDATQLNWLRDVGDGDKIQDVLQALQRLFECCPPEHLKELSPEECFEHIIAVTHPHEDLAELSATQRDRVIRILTDLYEQDWTRPLAACTIAALRGIPLHRIDGVVRGWDQGRERSTRSQSRPRGDSVPEADQVQISAQTRAGSSERDWETDEEGYPASAEATAAWADANGIDEKVAAGLWRQHGRQGWTVGTDKIESLVGFACASKERLRQAGSGEPGLWRNDDEEITYVRDPDLLEPGDVLLTKAAKSLVDRYDHVTPTHFVGRERTRLSRYQPDTEPEYRTVMLRPEADVTV